MSWSQRWFKQVNSSKVRIKQEIELSTENYCKIAVQSFRLPFFASESPRTLNLYIASWKAEAQATKLRSQP